MSTVLELLIFFGLALLFGAFSGGSGDDDVPDDTSGKPEEDTTSAMPDTPDTPVPDETVPDTIIPGKVIEGTTGTDTIEGTAGNDRITGAGGADLIVAGDGDDAVRGGPEEDTIFGGDGDDTLRGLLGADLILGEDGDDTIFGGQGGDILQGDRGEDVLRGEDGNDVLDGGLAASRSLTFDEAVAALRDGAGRPADVDVTFDDKERDALYGGAGDDTLSLGDKDVGWGGEGRDLFVVNDDALQDAPSEGATIKDYTPGEDALAILTRDELTVTLDIGTSEDGDAQIIANGEVIATIEGIAPGDVDVDDIGFVNINGPSVINGTSDPDIIEGTARDDFIDGGGQSDIIFGGDGDDRIDGGFWGDIILGGNGEDRIDGEEGRDQIFGGGGQDDLDGSEGDDYLQGGGGADVLDGGDGNDTLDGTVAFNRDLTLDDVQTAINGDGDLPDDIAISQDDKTADQLNGGIGDDLLILGDMDVGTGDVGADTFQINDEKLQRGPIQGAVITDFETGVDKLQVLVNAGDTPVITVEESDEGETLIVSNGVVIATIANTAPESVSAADIEIVELV